MCFIELTYTDNEKFFLNPVFILAIDSRKDGVTQVHLTDGIVNVKETPVQVLSRIPHD